MLGTNKTLDTNTEQLPKALGIVLTNQGGGIDQEKSGNLTLKT